MNAKGMLVPGNIFDVFNRPETAPPAGPNGLQQGVITGLSGNPFGNPPGEISTTYSKSFNDGGHEVLLPTVVNGKFLTDREAFEMYRQTGRHLGIFDTPENADAFAQDLHVKQERFGKLRKLAAVLIK